MENLRESFCREVCSSCKVFRYCEKDKNTIIGCATLVIWNKLENE